MSHNTGGFPFQMRVTIAALAGLIFLLLVWLVLSWSFGWSFIAGIIVAIIVYFLLGMWGDDAQSTYSGPTSGSSTASGSGAMSAGTSGSATAASAGAATASDGSADRDAAMDDRSGGAGGAAAEADADTGAESSGGMRAADASDADAGTNDDDAGSSGAGVVKPSTRLAGEEELAARKGTWKYQAGDTESGADSGGASAPAGGAGGEADTVAERAADSAGSSDAAAAGADRGEDYDGDGVLEGTDEGTKPEALDSPRGGQADNLKEIKGIGPKLEKLCNSLGFYHFDQIANWSPDEVARVNANLVGFKGRVSRDEWVSQAKILAAGGETEFSKRVEDGDVY